jgi:hypothetical protein
MAVFQMQYAKATPLWPAPRTTKTQTSLSGETSDFFSSIFLLKTWAVILTGVLQKANLQKWQM